MIQKQNKRLNVVVMIRKRIDIDDDNNNDEDIDIGDHLEFYWVIWDGSICRNNTDLFQLYDAEKKEDINCNDMDVDDDQTFEVETSYNNPEIVGSSVKVLVSPE